MGELILVTGATGFIGSHLVPRLTAAGLRVRALIRPGQHEAHRLGPEVEVVAGDVCDLDEVRASMRGCRKVFHLASTGRGVSGARPNGGVDVLGARNVAAACLEAGVERLIHASTTGVFGLMRHGAAAADETSPTRPNSHYRAGKLRVEEHLLSRHTRDGLPVVVVRLADTVGPGAMSWLGLCRALMTTRFRLIGTGRTLNQVCDVSDAVKGLELCAQQPGIEGRCYVIAGKQPIPVAELLAWMAEDLGVAPPGGSLPGAPFLAVTVAGDLLYRTLGLEVSALHRYSLFVTQKAYDISRARNELGFEPRASVREGIGAMVRWYREEGHIQKG